MAIGLALAVMFLAFAPPSSSSETDAYVLEGTGIDLGAGSTLTIAAAIAGAKATGTVTVAGSDEFLTITIDCLSVSSSELFEPYGIGHIAIGSGVGSDGQRYYIRTQKDGDTADLGSARLSTDADLTFRCGHPVGARWFIGPYRATPGAGSVPGS